MTFSYRILLTATAQDNVGVIGVRFYRDGEIALGLEDGFSPYSMYLYASTLSVGQHNITARARDAAGNVTISAPVTVNVVPSPDTLSPFISAISAFEITPFGASIRWTTNEPADGQIEFCPTISHCANFTPVVPELSTAHVINLSGLNPNTRYYYWIRSRDASGNLAVSSTRYFYTAPAPDPIMPSVSGRINVTANASDNIQVAGVRFYLDEGVPIRTEDTYPPYSAIFYTDTVINGPHTVYAVARDSSGNFANSDRVGFVINNPDFSAPFITSIVSSGITQFSATITWITNEPANGQIEFCTTNLRCGNFTPLVSDMTTAHTINLSGLSPGTLYYYRIISKDGAGNTATSLLKTFTTLQ
jgi:hypothetical protein